MNVGAIAICVLVPGLAHAEVGVQAGGRGGVDVYKQDAAFAGIDVRLQFTLSPLTLAFSFDQVFVDDGDSLQVVDINALYELPLTTLRPYGGIGLGIHKFAKPVPPPGTPIEPGFDGEGMRAAVNVVVGARLDHPALWRVKPFVQAMAGIGPIDLVTFTAGVLIEAKRR